MSKNKDWKPQEAAQAKAPRQYVYATLEVALPFATNLRRFDTGIGTYSNSVGTLAETLKKYAALGWTPVLANDAFIIMRKEADAA